MKLIFAFLFTTILFGCAVNDPVKTQSTIDDRPRITLDVHGYHAEDLELLIDGVSYGSADQYLNNLKALRIVPGNHYVEVYMNGRLITEKKSYFGEGSLTEIKVSK